MVHYQTDLRPFDKVPGLRRLAEASAHEELRWWRNARPRHQLGTPFRVSHIVPPTYESYVRILPPVGVSNHAESPPINENRTWSSLIGPDVPAGALAETIHSRIADYEARGTTLNVAIGHAQREVAEALTAAIATSQGPDVECLYYFWAGRGLLSRRISANTSATFTTGHMVFQAPLTAATHFAQAESPLWYQIPSAFWPLDRSWMFSFPSCSVAAYLGGPKDLVDTILDQAGLETSRVDPDTRVDLWA